MTTEARPPSAPAAPPRASRARRLAVRIGIGIAVLAGVLWLLFTWLFFNPLEGRVARLDAVIPPEVCMAVRGSAEGVLASPFVDRRLLARPEVKDLLRAWNLEEGLRDLDDQQARVNERLPGFVGGIDLRRDFLGSETAIFGSVEFPADAPPVFHGAMATRLSTKARMAAALLKHGWARERVEAGSAVGIRRLGDRYEIDLHALTAEPAFQTIWAARERDVLILGNDRGLVDRAAHLAATGGPCLADRPDAGTLFAGDSSSPLRAWVDLARVAHDQEAAKRPTPGGAALALEGLPGFGILLLDPEGIATAQAAARFPSADRAALEISGVRMESTGGGLADAVLRSRVRSGSEALKEGAVLAPAGSAVAVARLEAPAGALLRGIYGRLETAVRREIEDGLAEAKTSLDDLCVEAEDYLEPGASVVVERLPDCDALALDQYGAGPDGRFVLPVPGVLVVLRQRDAAGEGGAERFFRKWLGEWKDRFSGVEDLRDLPAGMTGIRFRPKFLTGDLDLVRPAVAFEGDLVLLALNEGTLRRALEARAGSRPSLSDFDGFEEAVAATGEGQAFAFVEMGAALRMAADQRREFASAHPDVNRDWEEVRRRIFREVYRDINGGRGPVNQAELDAETEKRMKQETEMAHGPAFQRVEEEYRRGLQALGDLRSLSAGLSWDTSGFHLALSVRTGE